jgi:tetratricopeptide (TPR) repeat protein
LSELIQAPVNRLSIFIASSNEMEEERRKCTEIFAQLNYVYKGLFIQGFDWKYNMVHGNALGYTDVQSAINEEHLKHANLVVFIFYSKIGKHTREEFDYAVKNNKRVFIYFKDGFSSDKQTWPAYNELLDFKETLDASTLSDTYKEVDDFGNMLYKNLNLYLSQTYLPLAAGAGNQDIAAQLEQSEKARKELEQQLASQATNDALKAQALEEISKGDYDAAEEHLMQSAKDNFEKVASTFYELAKIKDLKLQYQDAYEFCKHALLLDPKNDLYLYAAGQSAQTLGLFNQSMVHHQKSLEIRIELYGKESSQAGSSYHEIGGLHWRLGNYNDTIENCKIALEIKQKLFGMENRDVLVCYSSIGVAYLEKGEYDKAIEKLKIALSIGERIFGEDHYDIALSYNNIGGVYRKKGEYGKAIQYYQKAFAIFRKLYGEEHPAIAMYHNNIGTAYYFIGDYNTSIEYLEKALAMLTKFYPFNHPDIQKTKENLNDAIAAKNKMAE